MAEAGTRRSRRPGFSTGPLPAVPAAASRAYDETDQPQHSHDYGDPPNRGTVKPTPNRTRASKATSNRASITASLAVGALPAPELVRRIAFEAPRVDPAAVMAETLVAMHADGIELKDVLCDCGYSNRHPATFSRPFRRVGASLVMDLHPADRGKRGTFKGAICSNGRLYCPATPVSLLELGPARRGAPPEEVAAHEQSCPELGSYRFSRIAGPDADGYERASCPAVAGRLRCLLKAASMALSATHPSVLDPPPGEPARCCAQLSITVPPQVQREDPPETPLPERRLHRFLREAHGGRAGVCLALRPFDWRDTPGLVPPVRPREDHPHVRTRRCSAQREDRRVLRTCSGQGGTTPRDGPAGGSAATAPL